MSTPLFNKFVVSAAVFSLGATFAFGDDAPRRFLEARVFATSRTPLQLLADRGYSALEPLEQPDELFPTIIIDPEVHFQTVIGFGGAFTDASSDVFSKLPKTSQEQFLTASFDPARGNGYSLGRTTIHSSDYSESSYTYDDVAGDKALKNFSISHDEVNRLPFIKRAIQAAGGRLEIYASPWSPPAWMKSNNDVLHGGKLLAEYRQTWADYFVKYLKAYAAAGVPIWGVTVQNEALATQTWESCVFTADEEKDFVKEYLGPTFEKDGLEDTKIIIWDHNRGLMYQRASEAYHDQEASKYIWGAAFHWYSGAHFDNVRMLHDAYPDKHLIFTEGSSGGTWEAASRIALNVTNDLNNWAEGWSIWNLLLDSNGGPRHAGGTGGTSVVSADLSTGALTFNPPFYAFGHFSRFIRPGARRIACTSSSDSFVATAFENKDGHVAVVVFNQSDSDQVFQIWIKGSVLKYGCPAKGIMTFVL